MLNAIVTCHPPLVVVGEANRIRPAAFVGPSALEIVLVNRGFAKGVCDGCQSAIFVKGGSRGIRRGVDGADALALGVVH